MKHVMAAAVLALVAQSSAVLPRAGVDEFLREKVAGGDPPAVVAMVVDSTSTLYSGAFGAARPDGIFRIASMTKPVTSVAAMMLYEEGKLGLDDPLTKYLPAFAKVRVITAWHAADATYESRPPARPITIRDLLTHTSGLAYSFEDARLATLGERHVNELDLPLLHDPGEKFTYGPSTVLLGKIVERISGESLDVFFTRHIFDPLGMHDTAFVVPPDKRDRVVTVHMRQAGGTLREMPNAVTLRSAPRGDGGLFSTAADYDRFLQMILNRGRAGDVRLLREQTVEMMTSNQIGTLTVREQPSVTPEFMRPFPLGAGKDTFGFGFQIEGSPAAPGMRSVGSLSWGGAQNTHFWIDPQRGVAAVVLMQLLPYYDPRAMDVVRGFERLVYQRLQR